MLVRVQSRAPSHKEPQKGYFLFSKYRSDATQRNKFINAPYSFPYSGYYAYGGGLSNQGSRGHWLSRSAYTTAGRAYDFYLGSNGYVYPQNNSNVGAGLAVRCVSE